MSEPEAPDKPGLIGALYRHRRLLSGIAVVWFAGMTVGGIFLSQLDARLGLHVFGPEAWVGGAPSVLRVTLRELQFNRFEPLSSLSVRFVDGTGAVVDEAVLTEVVGPFVQGVVTPPRAGDWQLALVAHTPDGEVHAQAGIHAADGPAPAVFPAPPKPPTPLKPDQGPVSLDVVPTDQVLAGGVPGRLTVRARLHDGTPASVPVDVSLTEGQSGVALPTRVTTDHNGLAQFSVLPMHPTFWFELGTEDSHATRRLRPVPAQFALHPATSIARPGDTVPFELFSLHRNGPAFLDLWDGPRWIDSQGVELAEGRAAGAIVVPPIATDPALLWVQAYRTAYLPNEARGGRYLLVSNQPAEQAGAWLRDQLVGAGYPDAPYLQRLTDLGRPDVVRDLLGRLPRPDQNPPLLADSSVTVRQQTASLKQTWQRRFVVAIVASSILMFIGLAWLLWQNDRQVRRDWHAAGGDEEGDVGTRAHLRRDFGYIFLVLALFLFGMIQLLLSIRW